jgi:hypothetical protein
LIFTGSITPCDLSASRRCQAPFSQKAGPRILFIEVRHGK